MVMKRILILLSLFAGIALLKDYNAQELIYAVNIAYNADRTNKMLLSVAFNDNSPLEEHSVDVEGQKVTWKGPAYMKVN